MNEFLSLRNQGDFKNKNTYIRWELKPFLYGTRYSLHLYKAGGGFFIMDCATFLEAMNKVFEVEEGLDE
jgi:hypothetical protein